MGEPTHDLGVIGAGPAGCAAALAAWEQGLSVLLFEPDPRRRSKPCGEGMMPEGIACLGELGLHGVVAQARPLHRLRYCVRGARPLDLELAPPAAAIARSTLQAALDRAVAECEGIQLIAHTARVEPTRTGFCITTSEGMHRVRWVVGADGLAGSGVRRDPVAQRRDPTRYGIRAHFECPSEPDHIEIHLGRHCEVYLTPLPQARINVAILLEQRPLRGGSEEGLRIAFEEHPEATRLLGPPIGPPAARRLTRRSSGPVTPDGVLLVGDAAGGVDPVVGCGVTVALRSGLLAARAVGRLQRGEDSKAVLHDYSRAYARETRGRRRLARGLRWVGSRRPLALSALAAARMVSPLTQRLVRVAAGESRSPRTA